VKPPSRLRIPVWLLLVAIIGASAAIWALAPASRHRTADGDRETAAAAPAVPGTARGGQVDLSRLRQAIEVLSRAHADLGGAERRGAMSDLLSQGDAPTKLTMLLEAAAADPSEPARDPLWPDLVQGLSAIWQDEVINSGMDLMFTESRPRARDAVVSSFAKLALERGGELSPAQTQKLTEYFIDLHNKLPALQRREVEAAARKIAGNDVADLLQGRGMASDDELEVQREYKRSLQDSQRVATQ
jgi:hypothetical protein